MSRLKIAAAVGLAIISTAYILAFMNKPFVFIVFTNFASLAYLLICSFLLVEAISRKVLSADIRNICGSGKFCYRAGAFFCYILFVFTLLMTRRFLRLPFLSPLNILNNAIVFVSLMFLTRSLLKIKSTNMRVASFIFFVCVIFSTGFAGLRSAAHLKIDDKAMADSLPYLASYPSNETMDRSGVIIFNTEKACPGINMYSSQHRKESYLMNMRGSILHKWVVKSEDETISYSELYQNGDLLALTKLHDRDPGELIRLDRSSNVKWSTDNLRIHHDIAIAQNNDIYSLTRKEKMVFFRGLPLPITDNYIAILSPDGELRSEISLYEMVKNYFSFGKVLKIYKKLLLPNFDILRLKNLKISIKLLFDTKFDILHTNTIELINKDTGIFKKGNIVFCMRELNIIGVLDIKNKKVVWAWGQDDLIYPHHPSLLDNGNILVFDNGGKKRPYSRVVEINPSIRAMVWQYKAKPETSFFSDIMGGCQRLPNGNTLITEATKGRAFEVTPEGETIWEFYNPDLDKKRCRRGAIYRMTRITNTEDYPFLKTLK